MFPKRNRVRGYFCGLKSDKFAVKSAMDCAL